MKTHWLLKIVPAVLAMNLLFAGAKTAVAQLVLSPNFEPDPQSVTGTTGGPNKSNCGNVAAAPNQTIQVTAAIPYVRFTVESSGGKPTLLVEGPGGRFCVLPDDYSGGKPEISGFWQPGNYSLYVGELSPNQNNYTLTITKQRASQK